MAQFRFHLQENSFSFLEVVIRPMVANGCHKKCRVKIQQFPDETGQIKWRSIRKFLKKVFYGCRDFHLRICSRITQCS